MQNNIPFTKLQGSGNDFVLIDAIQRPITLSPSLIRQMSDRHFGIGFDQLLLIEPSQDPAVDFVYRIFNADGEEVGQCGNGARCVGHYLWHNKIAAKKSLVLSIQERRLVVSQADNNQIRVDMGVPVFEPSKIPFQAEQAQDLYSLDIAGKKIHFGAVNVGNPHAIIRVPSVQDAPVAQLGPLLEKHPAFPAHVNVGFMEIVTPHHIRLRVYERGAGETLACGSGACAAVVIGRQQELLESKVTVELTGGQLTIIWEGNANPIWMIGPAEIVFTGVIETTMPS